MADHVADIFGDVSCIIPTFNDVETLARAINSALKCTGISEVVVVDDGSYSNQTRDIVSEIREKSTLPVLFHQKTNGGPSSARNAGVRLCSGRWVTFLDADDELLIDSITSKAAHLEQCSTPDDISAVYGTFIRSDTGKTPEFSHSFINVQRDMIGRRFGFPGGVPSYVFRQESLLQLDGFSEEMEIFEDFEYILRMLKNGSRIVGSVTPGFIRHMTPNSLTRSNQFKVRKAERFFLGIAWKNDLLGRREVIRRGFRNVASDSLRRIASVAFKRKPPH